MTERTGLTGTPALIARIALYGAALAAGTTALQWLDYQRLARAHAGDFYVFLVAAGFLALGVFVGRRLFAARPARFDGNPQAVSSLGISARELAVLEELAAKRRTEAIARARELHIVR